MAATRPHISLLEVRDDEAAHLLMASCRLPTKPPRRNIVVYSMSLNCKVCEAVAAGWLSADCALKMLMWKRVFSFLLVQGGTTRQARGNIFSCDNKSEFTVGVHLFQTYLAEGSNDTLQIRKACLVYE